MRALRQAALPAGLALGLVAEWAALRRGPLEQPASPADVRLAVVDAVAGAVLFAAGTAAWGRSAVSRVGPLLVVTGFAWFLGTFPALGAVFLTLHRGPLVHALLSYPTGRIGRRRDRAAIAGVYAVSAVAVLASTPGAALAVAVLVAAVGAARAAEASGPERRARVTAAIGAGAFALVLAVSALVELAGGGDFAERSVLWAYDLAVAGIAAMLAVDLLRGRWTDATVTLVVELGAGEGLRDRVAAALGDRSLVLGYRLPGRDVYVGDRGEVVELPQDADRRATIVEDDGEPLAVLVHDADATQDRELLDSVAAAARVAVANATLQDEVRRRVAELEASRLRILEAGDAQRRRLAAEVRAGAEAALADAAVLLDDVAARPAGEFSTTLAEAQLELARARRELGELARGIHPRALTEAGLGKALRELAGRSRVPVDLSVTHDRFAAAVEAAAYFVCSEALANAAKHAAATRVTVEVRRRSERLHVTVADNGRGGAVAAGSGLGGLADRVEAVGGRFGVRSEPGEGTRVLAELPVG